MPLFTAQQLQQIEAYLADDRCSEIVPALEGLIADVEAYIDENCETTEAVQYFSFSDQFENLTYRRVEDDPRRLVVVEAPIDRAYADYAFCLIRLNDYSGAAEALKKAVRWNPMNCAYRLDLANLMVRLDDFEESLKLSYSVFARASRSSHLVRAYLNFADYFMGCEQYETAAACVKCALRLNPDDPRAVEAASRLADDHQCDPARQSDALTQNLLDEQGIPEGANVEIVISALLLADISAAGGDLETCQDMAQLAVDLVGQEKALALAQIVREEGEENYPEEGAPVATANEYASPASTATIDAAARTAAREEGGAHGGKR